MDFVRLSSDFGVCLSLVGEERLLQLAGFGARGRAPRAQSCSLGPELGWEERSPKGQVLPGWSLLLQLF